MHAPPLVAEVTLELAHDSRRGVARELLAHPRLEPGERVEQAEARDLDEIVERLTTVDVAERELARERYEATNEFVPRLGISSLMVGEEKLLIGDARIVGARHRRDGQRGPPFGGFTREVRVKAARRPVNPSRAFCSADPRQRGRLPHRIGLHHDSRRVSRSQNPLPARYVLLRTE